MIIHCERHCYYGTVWLYTDRFCLVVAFRNFNIGIRNRKIFSSTSSASKKITNVYPCGNKLAAGSNESLKIYGDRWSHSLEEVLVKDSLIGYLRVSWISLEVNACHYAISTRQEGTHEKLSAILNFSRAFTNSTHSKHYPIPPISANERIRTVSGIFPYYIVFSVLFLSPCVPAFSLSRYTHNLMNFRSLFCPCSLLVVAVTSKRCIN